MNLNIFDSAGELKDYVNDQSIVQSKIVNILDKDGKWYLFWYT